jgi:hypothetical protein
MVTRTHQFALAAAWGLLGTLAWAEVQAPALVNDPATSVQIGTYTVMIRTGADQALCRQVLQAIAEAGEDAINQCVPHPQRPETLAMLKPYTGLNWAVIREHLSPDFSVPDWQKRDLSDPHWHAEAMFLNTLLNLTWENTPVSQYYSDAEIRLMTDQYARDGTLPFDDGYDHKVAMTLNPGIAFYQAEFEFRGYSQTISRFKFEAFMNRPRSFLCEPEDEYPEISPIFFIEPTKPEAGIVVRESGMSSSTSFSEVLTFGDELYYMRNPDRFLVFERNLPYPETDPATGWGHLKACEIEVLRNGA